MNHHIGDIVTFFYQMKIRERHRPNREKYCEKVYRTGKVVGYAKSGGYLIKLEDGDHAGTTCNRNEEDVCL